MTTRKTKSRYWNPVCYGALFLFAGALFLIFSRVVVNVTQSNSSPAITAPGVESPDPEPDAPVQDASFGLSGILLMFSTASFLMTAVCIGWIVKVYRESRPAWKTQKRYPKHQRH